MFDLSIGLTYENLLQLSSKYRYDFLAINPQLAYGSGLLNSMVFVFRTIKNSNITKTESVNNVFVDVIYYRNINGFDAAIHGDCHFHILDEENFKPSADINLTDIISLKTIEDETGKVIYTVAKKQKIFRVDKLHTKVDEPIIEVKELKYMLFKINNSEIINCKKVELAKIFSLQSQHIWHNNRHDNYNDLGRLDINKHVNNKIDSSATWEDVKKGIEHKRESWKASQRTIFESLVNETWSLEYHIFE